MTMQAVRHLEGIDALRLDEQSVLGDEPLERALGFFVLRRDGFVGEQEAALLQVGC